MRSAGKRDKLVRLERATIATDDHGGEIESWSTWCSEWAQVLFGSGQEQREAAQTAANQVATFVVLANAKTLALTARDRVAGFLGGNWNITLVVPDGGEVQVTAVRKAA